MGKTPKIVAYFDYRLQERHHRKRAVSSISTNKPARRTIAAEKTHGSATNHPRLVVPPLPQRAINVGSARDKDKEMVALGSITEWQPPDGPVTTWMASPAACDAARNGRRRDLAPSYQRIRHLRAAYDAKAMGMHLPRLMVVAWEIPGVCDIPA